jgi:NitT/TauT family transport system substrate-binding protein
MVAAAVLVVGCSSGSPAASGIPALTRAIGLEQTVLKVAVVPAVGAAGFFIALHDGLFAQEGLKVRYIPATSSQTVIAGQIQGQYDITGGNYVSYIQAQVQGDARSVGGLEIAAEGSLMEPGDHLILTRPNSGIQTLSDLKGRYVALNAPGNVDYLMLASALVSADIPVQDVHFTVGVPFPAMAAALEAGTYTDPVSHKTMPVDAVAAAAPYSAEIQDQDGAATVADLDAGATAAFPIVGYSVTRNWARAHPRTLSAFLTALRAGQEIADTSRVAVETAFETLPVGQGHIDNMTAAVMALNSYPLAIDATRLQRLADVMFEFGLLRRHFSIQAMLPLGRLRARAPMTSRPASKFPVTAAKEVQPCLRRIRSGQYRQSSTQLT